jgi:DNA polymerase family A
MLAATDFPAIWLVDYEFHQPDGERPQPLCLVAHEWRQKRTLRYWLYGRPAPPLPPYPCDRHSLFVAYYASAELSCHLAMQWPLPVYVLDLYAEFRCLTNGRALLCGSSLLGALSAFGLGGLDAGEKEDMRALAIRGGPYSSEEQRALLVYCESDVIALAQLLPAMLPSLDFPRALLRGRSMKAAAHIEHAGIPVDTAQLAILRQAWPTLQGALIQRIDQRYHVYEGHHFRADWWEQWVARQGIPWPRLPSGRLALDQDTFRDMAHAYPIVNPMRELRASLSQLRLEQLAVGQDGRNRAMLSAFRAKTGRNAPSTTRFIFGPAVWLRHLIRPEPGYGVAYIDYEQQEFGIAAALSGDVAMQQAYASADPYLSFAKQAGAVPPDATRSTHSAERERFKACVLAVQYGMGAESLAYRIGQTPAHARALLRAHRQTYARFWQWIEGAVDYAMLTLELHTVFGWTLHVEGNVNPRTFSNFPMQSNGSEMLRLACSLATERGIEVCAPVHDAVLIHAPREELPHAIALTQQCMQQASEAVLAGYRLRTEAKSFLFPEHYQDARGAEMWQTVKGLLTSICGALRETEILVSI